MSNTLESVDLSCARIGEKVIDLGRLPVGEPIIFQTSSGSIYTLVRAARSERTSDTVSRVLISGTGVVSSVNFVYDNACTRYLTVGKKLTLITNPEGSARPLKAQTTRIVAFFLLEDAPSDVKEDIVVKAYA